MVTEHATMERLESILGEFKEAIVICDLHAWILLFNPQAKALFRHSMALNLRHSLYGLCHQAPFADAFRWLQERAGEGGRFGAESEVRFVCSTIKESLLLNCHMRLIPGERLYEPVFVLFFHPLPQQIDETGWKASDLARMIEELRAPLANLNAAAENLKANPEMASEERREFEAVIASESADLIRRFAVVVEESRALTYSQWPLIDIYSADLVRSVSRTINHEGAVRLTMTGVPLWLHADSHSLRLTLESLVRAVHQASGAAAIDLEVMAGERKVYFDIVWQGEPVAQGIVDAWFRIPLAATTPGITVADVLERHGSDMWCQPHRRQGYARLRIPAPDSRRSWDANPPPLLDRPLLPTRIPGSDQMPPPELADRPLSSLAYVAFTTVTTGLEPMAEHDILSIAGVRIEEQRILSDDSFLSLVNPQRPIPPSSVARHGISDGTVRGKPPLKVVLAQFRTFVADAVLVAHNAAIDLTPIRLKEERAMVRFDNGMLDTLLLSMVVDPEAPDRTLEGLCQRLGVTRRGGHAAMTPCLLTAQLFLRLLELLKAQGITTLGQAIAAAAKVRL